MDDLRTLQKRIYAQAVNRGLYKKNPSIKQLLWHIREEAKEAMVAYGQYGDLKTHYECKNGTRDVCHAVDFDCAKCKYRKNEGVEQELADVIIMTLSACEHMGIDVAAAIEKKMEFNAIRER